MYEWRKMTHAERESVVVRRRQDRRPWHTPPTWESGCRQYLISAACYEHRDHIGFTPERIEQFSGDLIGVLETCGTVGAWAVLPNHYHALIEVANIKSSRAALARLHGRSAFTWNGVENQRGRKVWHAAAETVMKSDRHMWATINYVHHNPVKHGHVDRWQDWPWSSAHAFLAEVGIDRAKAIWRSYPIDEYGKGWDD